MFFIASFKPFYNFTSFCVINHKCLTSKYYRCKRLEEVINNIKLESNYYKNNSITFEIPETHIISKLLKN